MLLCIVSQSETPSPLRTSWTFSSVLKASRASMWLDVMQLIGTRMIVAAVVTFTTWTQVKGVVAG
jgi:hypothetical protein